MQTTTTSPSLCPFYSKPNMDYSLTLNADDLTLLRCVNTLDALERSASLAEKIMKMEEFICMLSSCSNGSIGHEMSVTSMWGDATLTLSGAMAHQKKVTTTRSRMVTLSLEDSQDRAEMEFLRMAMSGLNLSWQEIERSFLTCARAWCLGHFSVISRPSDVTPTGNTARTQMNTNILDRYNSLRHGILNSIRGYNQIWEDMEIPVSTHARHSGGASCSLRSLGLRANVGPSCIRVRPIYNYTSLSWR